MLHLAQLSVLTGTHGGLSFPRREQIKSSILSQLGLIHLERVRVHAAGAWEEFLERPSGNVLDAAAGSAAGHLDGPDEDAVFP